MDVSADLLRTLSILAGLGGVIWRVITWHNQTDSAIEELRREAQRNEEEDARRDRIIKEELRKEIQHEKEMLTQQLRNHAQEDSRLGRDVSDLKKTTSEIWSALTSLQKDHAESTARLQAGLDAIASRLDRMDQKKD